MAPTSQLRIPGPTPVPDRVNRAMAAPMINHRGPEFRALLPELEVGLIGGSLADNDMRIFPPRVVLPPPPAERGCSRSPPAPSALAFPISAGGLAPRFPVTRRRVRKPPILD